MKNYNQNKRYFFDITDLLIFATNNKHVTGIQRVSFEIIKRMAVHHGTDAVRLSYFDSVDQDYISVRSNLIDEMDEFDAEKLRAALCDHGVKISRDIPPILERYRDRPFKFWYHHLRSTFNAALGNETYFRKRNSSIKSWSDFKPKPLIEWNHIDLQPTQVARIAQKGDRLILLGATWSIKGIDTCFQNLKDEYGLEISLLIHDLIPIITPEHVMDWLSLDFYRWLASSTGYCTSYFAVSKNTASDLAACIKELGKEFPIHTVPLAQEFTLKKPKIKTMIESMGTYKARVYRGLEIRREILNLSKVPFVLVVGTIESRKNNWRLAQAWQRLSREEGQAVPKLVFAGNYGWLNDDFNQMMAATGNLGGWVQFAVCPTDTELAFLYETCVFTAMVSFYEGWGLPIGESLFFGKTAVVAKNSALPEVGRNMVEYCDAHSTDSIYAACHKLIAEPAYRAALEARIATTKLRTWDEVTSDYVDLLSE